MNDSESGEKRISGVVRRLPQGVVNGQSAEMTAQLLKTSFQQSEVLGFIHGHLHKVRVKVTWKTRHGRSGESREPEWERERMNKAVDEISLVEGSPEVRNHQPPNALWARIKKTQNK